jgi:hypothetical protein
MGLFRSKTEPIPLCVYPIDDDYRQSMRRPILISAVLYGFGMIALVNDKKIDRIGFVVVVGSSLLAFAVLIFVTNYFSKSFRREYFVGVSEAGDQAVVNFGVLKVLRIAPSRRLHLRIKKKRFWIIDHDGSNGWLTTRVPYAAFPHLIEFLKHACPADNLLIDIEPGDLPDSWKPIVIGVDMAFESIEPSKVT